MRTVNNWRWWALLALATALSVFAGVRLTELRISTDLIGMLPDTEPASQDYRLLLEHFGALDNIYIVVRAEEGSGDAVELLADVACALADDLESSDWFTAARCGWDDVDEAFLFEQVLPRAALLVPPERSGRIAHLTDPARIRERVAAMKARLSSPLGPVEAPLLRADPLGLAEGLDLFSHVSTGLTIDPAEGVFLSRSESRVLVIATPSFPELDTESGKRMAAFLGREFAELQRESGGTVTFGALGGPLYAVHDSTIIRADAIRMSIGSTLMVTVLMLLYFGGIRVPTILVVSVSLGVVWTAACMSLLSGSISVLGISFAAILVGLGVDYGIHGASLFERDASEDSPAGAVMVRCLARVGPAIATSAATTAAAFLVLLLADLRPVRELGLLVASGILLILVTSFAFGAALLVVTPRRTTGPTRLRRYIAAGVDRVIDTSIRYRLPVLVTIAAGTVLATWGTLHVEFDASPRLMRPIDHPSVRLEHELVEDFALGLDGFTVVVGGPSLGDALARADLVARDLRAFDSSLTVLSPADFLVTGVLAEERSAAVSPLIDERAPETLRSELIAQGFEPAAFSTFLSVFDALSTGGRPPDTASDRWPTWLRQLVEIGENRTLLAVQVTAGPGRWVGGPPEALFTRIAERHPGSAIASIARVGTGLRERIGEDLKRLSGWCVLIVFGVVALSFRLRVRPSLMALLPVILGAVWLLGICGFAGVPINLFTVAVAPMLLGIGIDDGLHALHGADRHGGLMGSLRAVGPAMAITTLSTSAGFLGLTLSRLPALRGGGLAIALGTLLCLGATLMVLPAVDSLLRSRSGDS